MVVPDNVLFEDNTGRRLRTWLMDLCNLHTILRLPTGIFYAQGVKTNVLFFQRGKTDKANTKAVWVYDMRANMPAFGKTRPLTVEDFADFEKAYGNDPNGGGKAQGSGRRRPLALLHARAIKARNDNLDISWLRDTEAEAEEQLTEPEDIAAAIIGHLKAALEEIETLSEELEPNGAGEARCGGGGGRMNGPPTGWTTATLDELNRSDAPICYGVLKPGERDPDGILMVRVSDIRENYLDLQDIVTITPTLDKEFARSRIASGDVLVSVQGTVGRVAVVPLEVQKANISRTIARVRPALPELTNWLWQILRSPQAQSLMFEEVGGTTRDSLNIGDLRLVRVPIAPLAEQHRIVARIDSLSAKSGRARDHLNHIPRLVEKYKQAILAAAFRGELLPVREKQPFVQLKTVCTSITDGDHQAPPQAATGIPFITIAAMNDGSIKIDKATRFVPRSYLDLLKPTRRPVLGDILYSVTGSIGISAIVDFDDPFVFQRHIAILKPDRVKVDPRFLCRILTAPQIMEQALAVATGTAQLTIPLSGLREFEIPLPTLNAQLAISRRIETAFAWIDRLASEAKSARKLIDHLDQAVLAKAFRGELVPQDPNDEPASVFLERIRSAQSATSTAKQRRKPKTKSKQ